MPGQAINIPTVLVVEDDELFRRSLATYVASLGYATISCGTGEEALARCRESQISACVADYHLPSISGVELADRLAREKLGVPVVLITGFLTDDLRREAGDAGVYAVLRKPTDLSGLARSLTELLSQGQRV